VDPLADYNPFYNSEHYIDGEHNGGVYNSKNNNPYIYCYQSPVLFVDPNGKQNVFFETRSYAPFPSFGELFYLNFKLKVGPFTGDYRTNATTNPSVTSRISGKLDVNLQTGKAQSSTGVYTSYSYQTGEKVKATSKLDFESYKRSNHVGIVMNNYGHNKLVFGSPDIDVRVNATSYDIGDNTFRIIGRVQGDAFPSQELIFGDTSGNRILLSNFETKGDRNYGPMLMLPGTPDRPMGRFDINVKFDKKDGIIKATNNVTNESIKIDRYNK